MVKGMINRTIKNEQKISESILNLLKTSENPLSTAEIASMLGMPWHSVQTRCLRLQVEEKIDGFRAGRMNLWRPKK